MDQLLDFTGKVALVTGGSRGLGKAMVLALAERGADVVITSRKAESCEEVARTVTAMGRQALAYGCHVGHWDELEGLVDAAYERFAKVDILINNAGMSPLYPSLGAISEELFDKVMGVNLKGPFRLSALVGERMAAGEGGCIVNISSTASVNPSPTSEPYGAAKAGLNAITRSFAFALNPRVRVNCVIAGPFLTDISKAWDMEAFEKRAETSLALHRGGQPEEIVGAALYLASDGASFTTGTTIRVDGGTP
ncbi:MAG: SDR family oxidoreductase [Pseudomonadales bacterium]|jgi:NAD(P)-dependent dehydrogenase (short-subunit alcohol dehydrogenase family)|nr:SDR family oxidoreductase [Pseudomonadales bacterium]MDP6471016.1 SDR family oxidoreductase [Pseudomonadales bacterium]MDP6825798.1 SDR family oxidoreductase [Pseudomonadales bacterium]MDP6970208.1 SDR family oxidoreductase [Pseudomonadales bacterium]|tara:strand:- start:775 stop:1527 length:753 start_codon:yes stop_codon:yes gene_type:complete